MRKAVYKQIDERIEKVTIHHDESIDELGNVIPSYDEEIEVVKPIYGVVYEEDNTPTTEEPLQEEPTQLDIIEAQVMFTALMTDTLLEV